MEPNTYFTPQQSNPWRRWKTLLLVVGLALVGWLVAVVLINTLTFRVTKTDPGLKKVGANSVYLDVYFNRQLVTSGIKATYSEEFVSNFKASDSKIRFNLKPNTLRVDKKYTITLVYVASEDGKEIRNKKLTFTAKDIGFEDTSKAQQQAIVSKQDQYPYEVPYISWVNFDQLTSYITTEQLSTLETQLYGFSNQLDKQFWTVTLNPNTLAVKVHDIDKGELVDRLTFTVTLGEQTYQAVADANVADDSLHLLLTDGAGAVVYDSNEI